MNGKIKAIFEKIGACVSFALLFLLGVLFGKILFHKRDGTDGNRVSDRPTDDFSRNADRDRKEADRINQNAGESAKRIHDIIGSVRNGEYSLAVEGEDLPTIDG